jgi:osmotically-inducible protein OsmY
LRWITTLPEGAVQIRVEAGHVTLSGTVAHANEREVAYDAVHQVEGVVDVDNRIEVR